MDYTLINKYLQKAASEAEEEQIFHWIEASEKNKEEFILYKKLWALTAEEGNNREVVWNNLSLRFRKRRIIQLGARIVKYAAMLIVAFGLGITIYHQLPFNKNTLYEAGTKISAPLGQMTNVQLPDGTFISLNSGSSVTYHADFNTGKRIVKLQGEAFFDVAKDKAHPFIVKTSSLSFRVYGTSFNIEAYPEDKKINTTLVTGKLGVFNGSGKELTVLAPGQNAFYDEIKSTITVSKVSTDMYTSWKKGLITFRNEKLGSIARKIERWYNVEIIIENPNLTDEPYWGTIMRNKPISQILEVLKLTSSLKYKIVDRKNQPTLIYWN